MLSSGSIEQLDHLAPAFPLREGILKDHKVFPVGPLSLLFGFVQVVKPPLTAVFGGSEDLLPRLIEYLFGDGIPFAWFDFLGASG